MKTRLFPGGRLDWDSEGLLLLTNDGDFSNEVMHPRKGIAKTYLVKVDGQPTAAHLQKLLDGVTIIGGKVKALRVERQNKGSSKYDWIKISISEGKNRQVRRMFEKIGFDVTKLKRISIGQLKLGTLKKGEYRQLTALEMEKIFKPSKTLSSTSSSRSTSKKSPRRRKKR
jgi:23S rRNA pseudouridine2605 synthase